MVRLLRVMAMALWLFDASFNPTMVRLLPHRIDARHTIKPRFNPTMVRLLQYWCECCGKGIKLFQSHNGAIAAPGLVPQTRQPGCCFNPTMVRLLLTS